MKRVTMPKLIVFLLIAVMLLPTVGLAAMSQRHYKNRFSFMLDVTVRTNERVRTHLQDEAFCAYAQSLAEVSARAAERMTPPKEYLKMHHHFVLVLENAERSFYYAAQHNLKKYRHHQKEFRKELSIVEAFADRNHLDLYYYQ